MRTLRTARLQLRPLKAVELAEVSTAAHGSAAPSVSEETLRWMERVGGDRDPRLGGGWSFRHGVTGRLVGLCLYFSGDPSGEAAEISYIISPPYRGRGYCTEAMDAVVADLFGQVGFSRLYADVANDNPASLRVLEKLSFHSRKDEPDAVFVGLDRRPASRRHREAQRPAANARAPVDGAGPGAGSGAATRP